MPGKFLTQASGELRTAFLTVDLLSYKACPFSPGIGGSTSFKIWLLISLHFLPVNSHLNDENAKDYKKQNKNRFEEL